MTNGLAVPDTCGSGFTMLSEYCVAMAAVSLARGWSGENGAPKSGVSALICENRDRASPASSSTKKQLRQTKPLATCLISLARLKPNSTHGWVNCASAQIVCCVASRNGAD